jgi:YVTN family beta-propeller protein
MRGFAILLLALAGLSQAAELPGPTSEGYSLPNGWRITPVGKAIPTEDLILDVAASPDGRAVVAAHCGFDPHGLVVIDPAAEEAVQRIALPSAWHGLAWSPDGATLYVAGGNRTAERAVIYAFDYKDGRLAEAPRRTITLELEPPRLLWSGLAHHPQKDLLYAANQAEGEVIAFNTVDGTEAARVRVEEAPYDLVLSEDGATLYCSNWASDSVSIIDTASMKVVSTVSVGDNPNDMVLSKDGRLFVACSNSNSVVVVDAARRRAVETIQTTLHERAPEGSTPNALALDPTHQTLYVANADNNNVCVINVGEPGKSGVLGFIPAGWYPSALAVSPDGKKLFVGNSKGIASAANPKGPNSPLAEGRGRDQSIKALMAGTVNIVNIEEVAPRLHELTRQAMANTPYNDDLLALARPHDAGPSIVPREVGSGSPIKHVIYIIKENRTYDQVLGDMPQGNGDPDICIFGRDVTPNHHAIAEQFVLLDNLYCDAEVSRDGHQWSNAAYATDYVEKTWPMSYGRIGGAPRTPAELPGAGYLWDQCARKGLTYRSYGEQARRVGEEGPMEAMNAGLVGHVCPDYFRGAVRDTENAAVFIREFDEYERNYDNPDPEKRLPNFIVMSLPENHTHGTRPGEHTPRACVANNDYAVGLILERVSLSRYWPELVLFTIEDDAQDGADHVDARRTVGLVASPYCRMGTVDSTLYTTSSMLRTIELLLGLQPMSQFDAAANPMYACFTTKADTKPYTAIPPKIDVNERNTITAWGAEESLKMDFSDVDLTPMFELNEIIWKSVRGPDSEMPLPIHRFHFASR